MTSRGGAPHDEAGKAGKADLNDLTILPLWSDTIKAALCSELKKQPARNRYIGRYKLLAIWKTTSKHQPNLGPEREIFHLVDDADDPRLLILASVLVYIDWRDWRDFVTRFTNAHGEARFRLPLDDDAADRLLGFKGANFRDSQPTFLPVTIAQGENKFSDWDRLPFVEEKFKTSRGVSGTVTKIVVEHGQFRYSNGDINQKPLVLARKRLHYSEDYETEIEFLNEIRSNLRRHWHILAHLSTLAIGPNDFSILSKFADRGDLQQFLVGGFSPSATYRDRILEESANIADALDFLQGFKINGESCPGYHLDLKPANVLIFSHRHYPPEKIDAVGEWVITDFGVSVFHQRDADGASKTLPRREPGTYQPPEIDGRLGFAHVNAKGDIWSLGGIFCMILAFLVDGSRGVDEHVRRRSRTATGLQEQDFYYEVQHQTQGVGHRATAVLKPKVDEWLNEIYSSSPDTIWVSGMIDLIRQCLRVDEAERPDAAEVCALLQHPPVRTQPRLRTLSHQNSLPATLADPPVDPPSLVDKVKSFLVKVPGLRPKRSSTSHVALQGPSPLARTLSVDSIVPRSASLATSDHEFQHTQGTVKELVRRGNARHVAIDSAGLHAILCFSHEALIFDLRTESPRIPVPGVFDYINLAGHNLILYAESTLEPTFRNLSPGVDASFVKLGDEPAKFRTSLKTAVSVLGEVAVMQSRTVQAPRHLATPYRIPPEFGNEMFRAISFSQTGSQLWACGSKHWFMWDVQPSIRGWLLHPQTGDFPVHQDWQTSKPLVICFHRRIAMCLYDEKVQTLKLFDASLVEPLDESHASYAQVSLASPLLAAVVGCHDDQIFYVRLSESATTLGLYRRPIQGMAIGTETLIAPLPGLNPRAKFGIACRGEDSAQILTVISTQGECQSHRLDLRINAKMRQLADDVQPSSAR